MDMDKLVSLCKRRGFIFPSSEIYGGLNGFWDYGPLGVELKRNIKDAWWRDNITLRDDMVGIDCSIIMNPRVWEASGHVGGFSDPMADCKKCNGRFRADQLTFLKFDVTNEAGETTRTPVYFFGSGNATEVAEQNAKKVEKLEASPKPGETMKRTAGTFADASLEVRQKFECPTCKEVGSLTEPRNFNLMFESHAGAIANEANKVYLRPETAQGIFANFKNVVDTGRVKVPFGIGQIGKSFRNEINPRNFIFRSREFEQMEIEFFCRPEAATEWYAYWRKTRFQWYVDHGIQSNKLRLRDHDPDELAFYSTATADIEYEFPFGVSELEGIAHRGDYDLGQHQKFSGKDLTYFDEEKKERYLPHVIEPSAGADRATLAFLCEAYQEDEVAGETRTVLKFHPRLAPIKAAVFPLVKRDGMPEMAETIYRDLKRHFNVFLDEKGAIGRRYRRRDEAGTPFGITIDGQSITDGTVTFRDRDSCRQWRVPSSNAVEALRDLLEGRATVLSSGVTGQAVPLSTSVRSLCRNPTPMTPCISQATTLSTPFEADLDAYYLAGWHAVELWLTKLETYLESHDLAEAKTLLDDRGIKAVAAASQGGLLLSRDAERVAHWDLFRRRLGLLQALEVTTLIVAVDFVREMVAEDYVRGVESLLEAADLARASGVRLALEFQKGARFCASLDTTLALIAQSGAENVGVCFDLFHYYTGPSKFEDLGFLTLENLAWVQVCDLSGVPREVAGDSDRIFPGEGDFQISPIIDHLASIGYDGHVSLELLNPQLWAIAPERVADAGRQSLSRLLGRRESSLSGTRSGREQPSWGVS